MATPRELPAWILFLTACLLLAGGWFFSAFPLPIALAYAPLFALTIRIRDVGQVWERMEWVLGGLVLSFFAARQFQPGSMVPSLISGILMTLPFIAFVWVRQILGARIGVFMIIPFWLSAEYLLVKFYALQSIFLADAMAANLSVCAWNIHTGYLGISLWILVVNWGVYQVVFSDHALQWPWIVLAFVILIGPVLYSYSLHTDPINREDMLRLYKGVTDSLGSVYLARGEWVSRTCAWLSTLILLFTFVKSRTGKR